jgi:uroporphyrinogen-III synthase
LCGGGNDPETFLRDDAVMTERPLDGFVIGVTADRRCEEQAELLRRRGAEVLHAPVLKTLPLGGQNGLRDATTALIEEPPDFVVVNTGIGVRGWMSAADSWGVGDAVASLLREARVIARGPKAAGAVITAGGDIEWRAESGRLHDVVEYLIAQGVDGRRVALQLDGSQCADSADALCTAGADVVTLPVYRWTMPDDPAPVNRLVDAVVAAAVDAVTFTSAPAVDAFFDFAGDRDVLAAFAANVLPVCVGPVCHEAALARGADRAIKPERSLLGAMVNVLTDELSQRRWIVATSAGELQLLGSSVKIDGRLVELTERERAVLRALARRPGAVVAKRDLLREVWGDADADHHALEVTVGRLRRRLGDAGTSVRTVVRRGYQLV